MDLSAARTVLGVCAGTGALELGLRIAEPRARGIAYVEREASAAASLVASMEAGWLHPAPIWSDLATFDARRWGGCVDILASGDPCQPNSSAGRRLGAEDERFLIDQVVRVARECGPARIVRENVTGNADGQLEALVPPLERLGYRVAAGIFTASECCLRVGGEWIGPRHKRARLVIMADREDGPGWLYPGQGATRGRAADSRGRGDRLGDAESIVGWGEFRPGGTQGEGPADGRSRSQGASGRLGDPAGIGSPRAEIGRAGRDDAGAGPRDAEPRGRGDELGDAEIERRREGRAGATIQRRGNTAGRAGDQLADPGGARRQQDARGASGDEEAHGRAGRLGGESHRDHQLASVREGLADPGDAGLQGGEFERARRDQRDGQDAHGPAPEFRRARIPTFPPGPNDPAWAGILAADPLLAPAVGPIDLWAIARGNLGLAPVGRAIGRRGGMAWDLDAATATAVKSEVRRMADVLAPRIERLRSSGNGVVPLVVAYAYVALRNLLAANR